MFEYKITIFTPTYNRAYIIDKLYKSLQNQTYKNFEWLVIDDGSVDNTENLLNEWINQENDFDIRYFKFSNKGKHREINKALDLARGELFYVVDSDDYLLNNAIEKIVLWESNLINKELYCGISANLGITENKTPNKIFDSDYVDGNLLQRYDKFDGERAFIFYTEIHKKYYYPEFENEKFITEAVTYNRMAHDGFKMRFYNDIISVYKYQEDGLTNQGNSLFLQNPRGYALWIKEKMQFTNISLKNKIYGYYQLICDLNTLYSIKQISTYIGKSYIFLGCLCLIHKIVVFIKSIRIER